MIQFQHHFRKINLLFIHFPVKMVTSVISFFGLSHPHLGFRRDGGDEFAPVLLLGPRV